MLNLTSLGALKISPRCNEGGDLSRIAHASLGRFLAKSVGAVSSGPIGRAPWQGTIVAFTKGARGPAAVGARRHEHRTEEKT